MFSIFVRLLTSPKLEDLQRKELESAQKELLAAQTARDYAEAIAAEDEGPACCRLRSDTLLAANAELKELRQQRDELLAALKKVMECIKTYTSVGATLRAKAAIANAEGEKA